MVFDFTLSRGRDGPKRFFGKYAGTLVVDGYSGYNELFWRGKAREAGCWAHARRYLFKAKESAPEEAEWMLRKIGEMYRIEELCKEATAKERTEVRQRETVPLLAELR